MKKSGLVLSSVLVVAACGSTTAPAPPSADLALHAAAADLAGAGQASGLTLTIAAPSSLTGSPRQLVVAAFDQFPVMGPPAGILYQGSAAISAGHTVTVSGDAGALSGDKYVLAVLYMQGGGQLAPKANVDYVSPPQKIAFGGGSVAIATLGLSLLSPDGGF